MRVVRSLDIALIILLALATPLLALAAPLRAEDIPPRLPATYVEIKTGGHSLEHEDGRQKMLEALDAFLAEHLPVEG